MGTCSQLLKNRIIRIKIKLTEFGNIISVAYKVARLPTCFNIGLIHGQLID